MNDNSLDPKAVFTDIYARNVWGGHGSGGGSDPAQAKPYCDFVSRYLINSGIYTVLDIGCGDLRVARAIEWGVVNYIGIEASSGWVAPSLLGPRMIVLGGTDALTAHLPAADLVLCKEVLQHLSNDQVELLLTRTDHYPRRLFTSYVGEGTNSDIVTGQSRPVDLTLPPFNRPARTVLTYGNYIVQEL